VNTSRFPMPRDRRAKTGSFEKSDLGGSARRAFCPTSFCLRDVERRPPAAAARSPQGQSRAAYPADLLVSVTDRREIARALEGPAGHHRFLSNHAAWRRDRDTDDDGRTGRKSLGVQAPDLARSFQGFMGDLRQIDDRRGEPTSAPPDYTSHYGRGIQRGNQAFAGMASQAARILIFVALGLKCFLLLAASGTSGVSAAPFGALKGAPAGRPPFAYPAGVDFETGATIDLSATLAPTPLRSRAALAMNPPRSTPTHAFAKFPGASARPFGGNS